MQRQRIARHWHSSPWSRKGVAQAAQLASAKQSRGCIYAQWQCGARQRQARRRHNIQTQALSVARRSIEWFWSASVKHSKSLSSAVKQRQSKAMGSEATSRNGKVTDSTGFFSNGESRIAQRALRRWHRIVTQGYSWRRHGSVRCGDGRVRLANVW